ncbi:unnamed protein product [Arctia plantaginis]|uniref:Uncharacterized protein n=1 Tax=Arctia plantaginis TaxID=874455 RepID=A0A8S1AWG8_ARCPL|nr:unnamed protein product [Arctia plantaginis]
MLVIDTGVRRTPYISNRGTGHIDSQNCVFGGASYKNSARVVRGAELGAALESCRGRRAAWARPGVREGVREGRDSATRSAARRADLHAPRARDASERAASVPCDT